MEIKDVFLIKHVWIQTPQKTNFFIKNSLFKYHHLVILILYATIIIGMVAQFHHVNLKNDYMEQKWNGFQNQLILKLTVTDPKRFGYQNWKLDLFCRCASRLNPVDENSILDKKCSRHERR